MTGDTQEPTYDQTPAPDSDPVLGFARVIRYRAENLGRLQIKF